MNLQGLGAIVYGAMIMLLLAFATPSPLTIAVLGGAVLAYIASIAGLLYERDRLRTPLYGTVNLIAWIVSILFTTGAILAFIFGA